MEVFKFVYVLYTARHLSSFEFIDVLMVDFISTIRTTDLVNGSMDMKG